jgi:uncharacterized protein (TIGR03086 family)
MSSAELDLPTPCAEWDARAVTLHLSDVADAVINLIATGALVMPTPREATTPDPIAVAHHRIHALQSALAAADCPADRLSNAARGGTNELAAHGWDLATACGHDLPIPDNAASELLAVMSGALDEQARGDLFAPPVAVPPSAPAGERFVAFLGRQPS